MKKLVKQVSLGLLVVFLIAPSRAAERTWTGGGSDALWSTAANWNTGVPVSGDTLVFAGTTKLANTNDLPADTAFGGLAFAKGAGAFVLGGNALTLDGDLRSQAAAATVGLPLILSGDRLCLASNASITLSGIISGPGGLRFEGMAGSAANNFSLSGDNTFGGPVVLTNQSTLTVSSSTALGSAAAGTTVYGESTVSLKLTGGITLAEPITLFNRDYSAQSLPSLNSSAGTNVLTGPVYVVKNFRIRADQKLIFQGGIIQLGPSGGSTAYIDPQAGSQIIVTNRPAFLSSDIPLMVNSNTGELILAEPGNTYGRLILNSGGRVRVAAPNALSPYGTQELGFYASSAGATLDLNGFSQTVGPLLSAEVGGSLIVTSAPPAILTVNQRTDSIYRGDIAGAVSLVKTGVSTLTLTNAAPMTTTGSVTVAFGKLALGNSSGSSGGFGAVPAVRILPGGTLTLNNGSGVPDASEISVLTGGKLDIRAGVTETIARLYLDGVQQTDGTWGRTGSGADHINDVYFTSGTGLLRVTDGPGATVYTDVTWDAGGATNLLTDAANWAGDTLPSFGGNERAVFSAGSMAAVNTAASFYKLMLNRDADFTLSDLGGSLSLGRGGTEAGGTGTLRNHYVYAPVTLCDDQFLFVTNAFLSFKNTLSDNGKGFGLTVYGPGFRAVALEGDNTYGGKTTVRTNGYISIKHSHALGSAAGDTLVENGGYLELNPGLGNGITVADPMIINGDAAVSYGGTIRNSSGTNVLAGPILGLDKGSRIVNYNTAAVLDITGGIVADAGDVNTVLATDGGGTIRVREKPLFARSLYANGKNGGVVIFAVKGTVARTCNMNANVRLDTPNAFQYIGSLILGSDGGLAYVNLNGCDLKTCQLSTPSSLSYAVMFSAAPATLTVDQSASSTYGGSFTGALSVVKLGGGNLTLTNAFTTTSGNVAVRGGTLTVSNRGSLGPNCTNITVEGAATLALAQASTSMLADTATVRLPATGVGTAKISLAAGVNETVGWLLFGDQMMYPGTYGATGSGAQYVDDTRFSGAGVLNVLHGRLKGTLIRVN